MIELTNWRIIGNNSQPYVREYMVDGLQNGLYISVKIEKVIGARKFESSGSVYHLSYNHNPLPLKEVWLCEQIRTEYNSLFGEEKDQEKKVA